MPRKLVTPYIDEIEDKINSYKEEFEKLMENTTLEVRVKEFVSNNNVPSFETVIRTIKDDLLNNKSLHSFMNILFNRHGQKTDIPKRMICLLVDSIVFDLYMDFKKKHRLNYQCSFANIIDKCNKLLSENSRHKHEDINSGAPDSDYTYCLCNDHYIRRSYDQGKCMFYICTAYRCMFIRKNGSDSGIPLIEKITRRHIIQFIKSHYRNTQADAEFALLKYTARFLDNLRMSKSIPLLDKIEYLYSLNEYARELCSVTYTISTSQVLSSNLIEIINNHDKNTSLTLPEALSLARRNLLNRKSQYNMDNVKSMLNILGCVKYDEDIAEYMDLPIADFFVDILNISEDIPEKKQKAYKKNLKKSSITVREFLDIYSENIQNRTPDIYLEQISRLLNDISRLSRLISKYIPGKSDVYKIYSLGVEIYWTSATLLSELTSYDSHGKFRMRYSKIVLDIINLLQSTVRWDDKDIPLLSLLHESLIMFSHRENYHAIKSFDKVNTVLFTPYLKSLTFEYSFIDGAETVQVIVNFMNKAIIYIKNLMAKILSNNTIDKEIESYFSKSSVDNLYKDFFCNWETRKHLGCLKFDMIESVFDEEKNKIKKFL